MSNRVKRSIYFYTLEGFNAYTGQDEQPVELINVLQDIDRMPHKQGRTGRYLNYPPSPEMSLQEAVFNNSMCMGKIGFRRTSDLPYIENAGDEQPLDLHDGDCLFEPSHFVLFSNKVLGMEYNHHGPKAGNLRKYIERKGFGTVSRVDLAFILKPDVIEHIQRFNQITAFEIKVQRAGFEALRVANASIHAAAEAMGNIDRGCNSVRLAVYAEPYGRERGFSFQGIASALRRMLQHEDSEYIDSLKIKGKDSETLKTDEINILSDKMVSKKIVAIEDPAYKAIDSQEMYGKIVEAYDEMQEQILSSIRRA